MICFKCGEFGMLGTHALTIFMLESKQSSYTTAVSQCLFRIHQDTILQLRYPASFHWIVSSDRLQFRSRLSDGLAANVLPVDPDPETQRISAAENIVSLKLCNGCFS